MNQCCISHKNPPLYVAEEESTVSLHNTYTIFLQKNQQTKRSFPNSKGIAGLCLVIGAIRIAHVVKFVCAASGITAPKWPVAGGAGGKGNLSSQRG